MEPYKGLQAILDEPRAASPDKIALRAGPRNISYAELDLDVRRLAGAMRDRGVRPRDRVAWFLPNCPEAVMTTLACYQIGAISVPLNYRYVSAEAQHVIERTKPGLLIFHAEKVDVVDALSESLASIESIVVGAAGVNSRYTLFSTLLDGAPLTTNVAVAATDPALILYTSGSTGHPRGVVHSHAGAFQGIAISRQIFDLQSSDVVLVGKPISHAGGLETQLLPALLSAGEVILAMKPKPADAVALIRRHSVTQYGLLASDLIDFIEYLEANPTELPSLRNSIGSGDVVPHDLHHRFQALFGWQVMEGCGMTEVGGYYAVNPRYGTRKWGSLGIAAPDTQIRVINSEMADVACGHTGEIVVRTPSATTGYWDDHAASQELFHDGWLRTGDLGHIDEEGYVWFTGRKKLMIVRRGSNIAPAEIEVVLAEHPKVHAAVVVGVPDEHDGQVPVACVAPRDVRENVTDEELRSYVAERLAAYKNPTRYFFFPDLPRNSTGKFDRHRLEEVVRQSMAGPAPGKRAAKIELSAVLAFERVINNTPGELLATDYHGSTRIRLDSV